MATCKLCGDPIKFSKVGKVWNVSNPDGSEHWDTCKAKQFEFVKENGAFFEDGYVKGYRMPDGQVVYTQQGTRIVGDLYKPSGDCAECCAPWEVCSWPCPDSLTNEGNHDEKSTV